VDGEPLGAETVTLFISYVFWRKNLELFQIHKDSSSSDANSSGILLLEALGYF